MPNEYPQQIVDKILNMTRQFPAYSYVRIAVQLQIEGVSVSASGVRKVWERNGLHAVGGGLLLLGGLRAPLHLEAADPFGRSAARKGVAVL